MTAILAFLILILHLTLAYPGEPLTTIHYGDGGTLNEGILVIVGPLNDDVYNHSCGYETRGTEGFFCDVE